MVRKISAQSSHKHQTILHDPKEQQVIDETRRYFQKVYAWMFLGLILSSFTAYAVAFTPSLTTFIFGNFWIFIILILAQFGLVVGLVGFVKKISANAATIMFLAYSILTGLTFSVIFLVFTIQSIGLVFFLTSFMFAALSIYGFFTRKDLTSLGPILYIGLFGIIIAMIVNMFLGSSQLDFIISIIGVIIFTGLIMYDTQKLKKENIIGNEGTEEDKKEAIIGALRLYLDFINLFLMLLRLLGKRR